MIVSALTGDPGHSRKVLQRWQLQTSPPRRGETFLMVAIRNLYWTEKIATFIVAD